MKEVAVSQNAYNMKLCRTRSILICTVHQADFALLYTNHFIRVNQNSTEDCLGICATVSAVIECPRRVEQ